MGAEKDTFDAGLRSLNHYKNNLPGWRYRLRECMLPIVRWETPYVAWLQENVRSSALDVYFAMTANLGTHTAFTLLLPPLLFCGFPAAGRGLIYILAAGVYFSGWVKDLLCLPRPLSPPLTRITMSDSAALEYGFPSTHSTNAVSVAVCLIAIIQRESNLPGSVNVALQALAYFYAVSIVLGRVYCGMHGFLDVLIGSALGIMIGLLHNIYGEHFYYWMVDGPIKNGFIIVLIVLVLIRTHPEPADDCPCFDDSVAFAGVVMGLDLGLWHFARTSYSWSDPLPGTAPFDLKAMGWVVAVGRVVVGVVVIFIWRSIMKSMLLTGLPPIFRVVEGLGLDLPRRFFTKASQYDHVPHQADDDNVIPRARDIPGFLSKLRRRHRSISVGPQSEADAYEAIAYRQKRRRDSLNEPVLLSPISDETSGPQQQQDDFPIEKKVNRQRSLSLKKFRAQMGMGMEEMRDTVVTPPSSPTGIPAKEEEQLEAVRETEMLSSIKRPRVRYDVEVVTRLIVYSGIGWLAAEGNNILFQFIGLGLR